jgi:hypothetical protein
MSPAARAAQERSGTAKNAIGDTAHATVRHGAPSGTRLAAAVGLGNTGAGAWRLVRLGPVARSPPSRTCAGGAAPGVVYVPGDAKAGSRPIAPTQQGWRSPTESRNCESPAPRLQMNVLQGVSNASGATHLGVPLAPA